MADEPSQTVRVVLRREKRAGINRARPLSDEVFFFHTLTLIQLTTHLYIEPGKASTQLSHARKLSPLHDSVNGRNSYAWPDGNQEESSGMTGTL